MFRWRRTHSTSCCTRSIPTSVTPQLSANPSQNSGLTGSTAWDRSCRFGWESKMRIAGKRIRRDRLIRTEKYVIVVEIEMVLPEDDPSEPCMEAETVQLLKQVR